MGQFNERLFEAGGETGHPYRLWKRDGVDFEMPDLDLAQRTISQSGREVVMGALDRVGHVGVIRVKPELDEEVKQNLGALGIGEEPYDSSHHN